MRGPIASDYDLTYDYLAPEDKEQVEVIITGNHYDQYGRLYDDGVRVPVFWNPDKEELMQIVNHKANIINKIGATIFYEDQIMQVQLLKALCPKTKIIHITGGSQ